MRLCVLGIAALTLTALPASAQSPREVTGPWTLTPTMLMCTDLPVPSKPLSHLTVFGIHSADVRFAAAQGTVVIKRVPDDGLKVGQRYIASRMRPDYRTNPREGFADMRVSGVIEITAVDDVNAMASITRVCDAIEPGDDLEPFVDTALPRDAATMDPPDFSDRAHVLFGNDSRVAFGFGDTLSIDRGTLHGVVAGARYAIYRDKKDGMPLIYVGEVVVMVTDELSSKVAVTKADGAIESGDVAVPRRKP